jgi:hypothetical protein
MGVEGVVCAKGAEEGLCGSCRHRWACCPGDQVRGDEERR